MVGTAQSLASNIQGENILEQAKAWRQGGRGVAVATVVAWRVVSSAVALMVLAEACICVAWAATCWITPPTLASNSPAIFSIKARFSTSARRLFSSCSARKRSASMPFLRKTSTSDAMVPSSSLRPMPGTVRSYLPSARVRMQPDRRVSGLTMPIWAIRRRKRDAPPIQ